MSTDQSRPDGFVACFTIRADAEPGTLLRLIEPFAKRNLVPMAVYAGMMGADNEMLAVDFQVAGLDPVLAEVIAEGMRQMVCVEHVRLIGMPAAAVPRGDFFAQSSQVMRNEPLRLRGRGNTSR
jgi:hypothetical protein